MRRSLALAIAVALAVVAGGIFAPAQGGGGGGNATVTVYTTVWAVVTSYYTTSIIEHIAWTQHISCTTTTYSQPVWSYTTTVAAEQSSPQMSPGMLRGIWEAIANATASALGPAAVVAEPVIYPLFLVLKVIIQAVVAGWTSSTTASCSGYSSGPSIYYQTVVDSWAVTNTYTTQPTTTQGGGQTYSWIIAVVEDSCPPSVTWTVSTSAQSASWIGSEAVKLNISTSGVDVLTASASAPPGVQVSVSPTSAVVYGGGTYYVYVTCGAYARYSVYAPQGVGWVVKSSAASEQGSGAVYNATISISPGGDTLYINVTYEPPGYLCNATPASAPVQPGGYVVFNVTCDYYANVTVISHGGVPSWEVWSSAQDVTGAGNATFLLKLGGASDAIYGEVLGPGWTITPTQYLAQAGGSYVFELWPNSTIPPNKTPRPNSTAACVPEISVSAYLVAEDPRYTYRWSLPASYTYSINNSTNPPTLTATFTVNARWDWGYIFDRWIITANGQTQIIRQNPATISVPCNGTTPINATAVVLLPPVTVSVSWAGPGSPDGITWYLIWYGVGTLAWGWAPWSGEVYVTAPGYITTQLQWSGIFPAWITPTTAYVQPGSYVSFTYGRALSYINYVVKVNLYPSSSSTGGVSLISPVTWTLCSSKVCISGVGDAQGVLPVQFPLDTVKASVAGSSCTISPSSVWAAAYGTYTFTITCQ